MREQFMHRFQTWAVSGICGLLAACGAVIQTSSAHHSTAMFDKSRILVLDGTVVELRWTNPHAHLVVNGTVKAGEQPEVWLIETTSPANLQRTGGWSRTALKPGDRVRVEFAPLRDDDARGGRLGKVTLVDTGQIFTTDYRDLEPGVK
jgi:Family of unknown function (DUF6152)